MDHVAVLLLVKGLTIGSVYALISLGFNVIYRTTGVLNFAQGEFLMVGGVTAGWLHQVHGWPVGAALPGGILAAGLAGLLVDQLAIRPVRQARPVTPIIITIGVSIILRAAAALVWGTEPFFLPPLRAGNCRVAGVTTEWQAVVILVAALGCMLLLAGFFRFTRVGRAMQACSENAAAARLCGVNPGRVSALAFVLSAVLAGVAGVVITPQLSMSFDRGTMLGLKGFCAAVLGGLGSPVAGVAGGFLIGLLEQYSCWVSSVYKETLALVSVVIILLLRPKGLLAR